MPWQVLLIQKKLTEKKRDTYAGIMRDLKKQDLVFVAVASISAQVIDRDGIVAALRAALKKALYNIAPPETSYVYLDGSLVAPEQYSQETIIKGDSKNWLISAASVIAKVTRDQQMKDFAHHYPEYSFENNKGYGTKAHYQALKKHGCCPIHRTTWIKI
jgi:ribonuclease HII